MTATEFESDFKHTTNSPYLTPMGKLWGACYDDFLENLLCYNGTTLYKVN